MILFLLAVLPFLWLSYKFFKDELTSLRKIPKADGSLPVIGHALTFLRERNHLELLREWCEKHGPIFRYNRGFGKFSTTENFMELS